MNAIKKYLALNLKEKILAVVVTIVVWIIVVSLNENTKNFTVKIDLNLGEDKVLVSEGVSYLHVKATGNIFNFARIGKQHKTITIDLSRQRLGKNKIFLDSSKLGMSEHLKIQRISPSVLEFATARKSEKKVSVEPYIDGQPKRGYKVSSVKVEPSNVVISGPDYAISEIESVSTGRVSLVGMDKTVDKDLEIALNMPYIKINSGTELATVKVVIERDVREVVFRHVPLTVDGLVPADMTPSHIKVKLKGPIDILENLQETGIKVYVENRKRRSYKVQKYYIQDLPEGVTLVDMQKIKEIKIKKRK